MEFSSYNFLQTTTMIEVNSNTDTSINLFNPDITQQYVSDGFNNDLTTTTLKISFLETTTISRIGLKAENFKQFIMYYDEATANTFNLDTDSATTVSEFIYNSESSMFFKTNAVECTSVSIDIKSTIQANSEKALGLLYLSNVLIDFPRVPSAANYKPKKVAKKVIHQLADGGVRIQLIDNKWNTQVKFKHIEKSFVESLNEVYESRDPCYFIPFPTTTGWDGIAFEASWMNDFEFYTWSDNAVNAGYSGSMKLQETPD